LGAKRDNEGAELSPFIGAAGAAILDGWSANLQ
jgi:hypothetical protein